MQKQHLEMIQRLLCWRVHFCNIPTEHKHLKQHHIPPAYFGTCFFLNCCSVGATALHTAEAITFPGHAPNEQQYTEICLPRCAVEKYGCCPVASALEMSDRVESLSAVLYVCRLCCMCGHLYFPCTLHYCIVYPKVFHLKVLANLFFLSSC